MSTKQMKGPKIITGFKTENGVTTLEINKEVLFKMGIVDLMRFNPFEEEEEEYEYGSVQMELFDMQEVYSEAPRNRTKWIRELSGLSKTNGSSR